jgi:hypothetical protein
MTVADYEVSPAALERTAAGIETVLDGLRALGPLGAAEEGRGVARLGPMPGDVGHAGLSTAFVAFCNRWEWGVRAAVRRGRDMAEGLRAAGESYGSADGAGQDLLARLASDLAGDPGAAGGTWAEVAAEQMPEWRMPDGEALAAGWATTGRDLLDHSLPGMVGRMVQGGGLLADPFDDLRPIAE